MLGCFISPVGDYSKLWPKANIATGYHGCVDKPMHPCMLGISTGPVGDYSKLWPKANIATGYHGC